MDAWYQAFDVQPTEALYLAPADRVIISGVQRARVGRKVSVTEGKVTAFPSGVSRGETSTLSLIQMFLYAISALVVGAFFTVWTIQRKHEIAVLRALGAPTRYLLRDGLAQALLLLLAATAVGSAIGYGVGALIGGGVPFALWPAAVVTASALLIVLGLLGSAAAIARIASVDPLTALGGAR